METRYLIALANKDNAPIKVDSLNTLIATGNAKDWLDAVVLPDEGLDYKVISSAAIRFRNIDYSINVYKDRYVIFTDDISAFATIELEDYNDRIEYVVLDEYDVATTTSILERVMGSIGDKIKIDKIDDMINETDVTKDDISSIVKNVISNIDFKEFKKVIPLSIKTEDDTPKVNIDAVIINGIKYVPEK